MPDQRVPVAETAASQVFATPEMLGEILGHLDPVEFAQVQLAHPNCLDVAKDFPHLRRQFFLEQESGAIDGGFRLNPIFEVVFRIFGWSMGPTELVRRYPEEAILRYRPSLLHLCPDWKDEFRCSIRQSYKLILLDENAWRFVLDLRPLLQQTLFAKASHPVSIFPICDRDRDLVPYGYVDVVEGANSVLDVLRMVLEQEISDRVVYKAAVPRRENHDRHSKHALHDARRGLGDLAAAVYRLWQ